MKSYTLLIALILSSCTVVLSQNGPAMNFDQSLSAGIARERVIDPRRGPKTLVPADVERRIFSLLNETRRSKGLSELEWSDDVAMVARLHSQNMAEGKFFSHRGSDGSMVDERADRIGLGNWLTIGENIAYMRGYSDPVTLSVDKWMESAPHRKNLLGPNWKESAVGVAVTSDGTYYVTQVFLVRQ